MFFGDFKESNDSEIVLKDVDLNAFKVVLKYCYFERLFASDWSPEGGHRLVMDVFRAAHLYQMKSLCRLSQLKLIGLISVHNFTDILEMAELYRIRRVLVFLQKFAKTLKYEIIVSKKFLNCRSINSIKFLIKSMKFDEQIDVFKVLVILINNNKDWSFDHFQDCLKMESLSADELFHLRDNPLIQTSKLIELLFQKCNQKDKRIREIETENNDLRKRLRIYSPPSYTRNYIITRPATPLQIMPNVANAHDFDWGDNSGHDSGDDADDGWGD